MNNFDEDESFVHRIKIKNLNEKEIPIAESINSKKINIDFYPEGGNLISNISNNIGLKVTDINGKSIPNCLVEIQDNNNNIQKSVLINAFGIGKFEFTPNDNTYKAVLIYNTTKFEYELPASRPDGICLELNNYIYENKTILRIKYNKGYEKKINGNNLYLVIQKNEKSNIIDFKLDSENRIKEFSFSNELLFNGVNSIRIIDSEMNEIAQRLLFQCEAKTTKVNINASFKNNAKVDLSGNSNWNDACVSVSTLPANTKLSSNENIITSLTLNAFLNEKLLINSDYFNEINRPKKHELDLMMLTQKGNKYEWNKIKNKTINPIYSFEKGLDLKGTINNTTADVKNCRIQLKNILSDVLSSTEIIDKDEFFLKNTSVTDSLMVICDLIDAKDRSKKEMNYYLTITNKHKKFNNNFIPIPYIYPIKNDNLIYNDIEMPFFDIESILLEEVAIKREKIILKRQNQSGNSMLRGFKVGVDVSENIRLIDFIGQNGFTASNSAGTVTITGRTINSLNAAPHTTPAVFIDGRELMNFDELDAIRMDELDEIYISSTAMVPSILNKQGIIKIYRKLPTFIKPDPKNKPKMIIGGFELITPFVNADYLSEKTVGFENLGVIYWSPWILTDEKGNVKVTIPNNNHKKVKLLIEGFTFDGKLISEIKEVNLEE